MAGRDRCARRGTSPGGALIQLSTAVVTGASRGIGAAVATELARRGAHVVLSGRDGDALRVTAARIAQSGGAAEIIPADLADAAQAQGMVAKAIEVLGEVDLFVSNAAVLEPIAPVWEADMASVRRALDVNVLAPWLCLRVLLPHMIGRGRGSVVAISSSSARQAFAGLGSYCASKAAFEQLHLVAARECAGSGVTVKVVWPGGVDTDMQAQLRTDAFPNADAARDVAERGLLRDPDYVASLIVDVCSGAEFEGDVFDVDSHLPFVSPRSDEPPRLSEE